MNSKDITIIKEQVRTLTSEQKAELIKFLTDTMLDADSESKPLKYGKYLRTGRKMATENDFKIAEWQPTERELNGN